ncbi:sensor histidine kinase [Parendozoicomonas haliclonae]|uniref:histidine kinase n=1 Tax=Parendozoicomonas haliclonae TaxID=1960125 RepID=A0A1X7AP52_9GAMM|nr:sensor histidine kinase [Parendozoicomonas haliclonae]SMA50035.1 Signal transduction histidine-protein kinase BaeS [Parendozoicomonas haliclonae]
MGRTPLKLLIGIMFILLFVPLAKADVLPVLPGNPIPLDKKLAFYTDPTGRITLQDILAKDPGFEESHRFLAQGFTRDSLWLRIPLARDESVPDDWVISVTPSYLEHFHVWIVQDGRIVSGEPIGRFDKDLSRQSHEPLLQTTLTLPEGRFWLYMRIQTGTTLAAMPVLYPPEAFAQISQANVLKMGIVGGILLLLFIVNFGFWLSTQINLYGYFAGYVGFGLISLLDGSGMLSRFLLVDSYPETVRVLSVGVGFSWLFGFLFFMNLLLDREKDRWIYPFYYLLFTLALMAAFCGLMGGMAYSYIAEWIPPVGIVVCLLTLIPSWRKLRYGRSGGERFQGGSFFPMAFFLGINQLYVGGWLEPSPLTVFGQTQGGLLQIVLIQIALLFRMRDLLDERNNAVAEARRVSEEVARERKIREEQSRFLSMITHEIRTPLAVIDMAIQSLKVYEREPEVFRSQRYSRIQSSVQRMATLLELGLKKDGFSSEIWQPDDVVYLDEISDTVVSEMPADEQVRIQSNLPDDLLPIVGNTAALKMVFFNLLENALKYSSHDDPVLITVGREQGEVFWQVEDRGPGVPQSQRKQIFEKFYRASEVTGKPGLGLGLYIARQIIERHGGRVELMASRWGGACFRCAFKAGEG